MIVSSWRMRVDRMESSESRSRVLMLSSSSPDADVAVDVPSTGAVAEKRADDEDDHRGILDDDDDVGVYAATHWLEKSSTMAWKRRSGSMATVIFEFEFPQLWKVSGAGFCSTVTFSQIRSTAHYFVLSPKKLYSLFSEGLI